MIATVCVFIGAVSELTPIWTFSDVANGLMALPNLIGLLILSGLVVKETRAYLRFDPKLHRSPEECQDFLARQGMDWK